ncbi:MAG: hypothetical protein M3Y33_14135 [Actinomycetota bacterium]|nr:hypothetical protein [Actinomycetota bacterium]
MPVTDEQVVLLLAYLTGEGQAAQRAAAQITAAGKADGFAELAYAAFLIAARRHFTPGSARAEIIRFVARTRALGAGEPDSLAAENELRSALGETTSSMAPAEARTRARVILLAALVASAGLAEDGVIDLLLEARRLAERMLAERAEARK